MRRLKSTITAATFSAVRSPGTTLMINRLSASIATWSQVSPLRSSAGSAGSQFFSFFATKDHFSSNWTSRVRGGKLDQLVVEAVSVLPSDSAQAADSAAIHVAKSAGLADAAPLGDVIQDRFGLLRWQPRVEERRPLSLGKAGLAGAATEHAALFMRAVAAGHGQISGSPLTVVRAVEIEAAETREVIHVGTPPVRSSVLTASCAIPMQ